MVSQKNKTRKGLKDKREGLGEIAVPEERKKKKEKNSVGLPK